MVTLNYSQTHFVISARDIRYLPSDTGIEVAFIGRSNSGKSSALNTLTNKKNLARISKIPGRTRLLNLFEVAKNKRLVDLPGYGYSQVPKKIKIKWERMMNDYLENRLCLRGLVVLIDIRRSLNEQDKQIISLAVSRDICVLVLLTKADKLTKSVCKTRVNMVRKAILTLNTNVQIELFSSLKKQGVDKLRQKLDSWFNHLESLTVLEKATVTKKNK